MKYYRKEEVIFYHTVITNTKTNTVDHGTVRNTKITGMTSLNLNATVWINPTNLCMY